MKLKIKTLIRKYTPYILLLLGIWVIVAFFIAGGVNTSEQVMNPNNAEERYLFTLFQVMFGKSLTVDGTKLTYFKPNFFGFIIIPFMVFGLILPTINKVNFKTRHMVSALLLLVSALALFILPKVAVLGSGWVDPSKVVVTMGPVLIVTGSITAVFAVINFALSIFKE